MASLYTRLTSPFRRLVSKASGGWSSVGSSVNGWLYGAGVGLPNEPFAGAWQRNLEQSGAAGPNIVAFGAVYSCVNIISSDIARLPIRIMRPREEGGMEVHEKHPAMALFRKPNDFQTLLQFLQYYLASKLLWGNAYVYLVRDGRGVPYQMYALDPRRVRPLLAADGSVFYELAADPLSGIQNQVIVTGRDVVHDRAVTLFHPLVGVTPLFAAGVSAALGARIIINSDKFFANLSRSSGIITAPGKIEDKVAQKLQSEWERNFSGGNIGKVAVLANGLKYDPMTMPAVDAQLIEQLRWTEQNIAGVYRVPGFKLGDLNKVTYRNSEQMARDYFQGCLSYHIDAFEQCFKRALELDSTYTVEFDLRPLFRMETDTRYASYQTALNAGFMSINEVRAEEGLAPVEGGEEPRVQAQYIPLSKATGEGVDVPGATPSPAPAPGGQDDPADPADPAAQDAVDNSIEAALAVFKSKILGEANAA